MKIDETWAPLDQWVKDTIDEWDGKLPRAIRIIVDSNAILLKAVELRVPHSTGEIYDRYKPWFEPIRAGERNLTREEIDSLDAHNRMLEAS